MAYSNKSGLMKFMLPVILLFTGLSCSSSQNLITQSPDFNPDAFQKPNEHGIKNSTEFFKKPEAVIENSKFVPARIDGGTRELIGNVKFPSDAIDQYQEGQVYLNLFIDETGEVVFVRVLESPDDRLTRYSIYAVKNTKFFPATLDNVPVKSTRLVMFDFNFAIDNEVNY